MVVALATLLGSLGGCAARVGASEASPSPDITTAAANPPADQTGWGTYQATVTAVLPGDSASTVLLRTEIDIASRCVAQPEVSYETVEGTRFFANVTALAASDPECGSGVVDRRGAARPERGP